MRNSRFGGSVMWVVLLLVVGAPGCSGVPEGGPPKTFKVKGKVFGRDGRPLPGGRITFHPEEPANSEAIAEIERDGTFALGTFGKDDGAMPGRYKVSLEDYSYRTGDGQKIAGIPDVYKDPRTSGWTAEVTNDTTLEPFRLK